MRIPIETSARHVHLSEKDFKKLFGENAKLIPIKKLSQPGEFASKEIVTLSNGRNKIENVRVVGPLREKSQIEISKTDSYKLKKKIPVRLSGKLIGVPKIRVKGKKGIIAVSVIVAQRHLHCSVEDAKKLKLKNGQKVSVRVKGQREITFHNIIVRVSENYKLALHIDTDEANAAGIERKAFGELVR